MRPGILRAWLILIIFIDKSVWFVNMNASMQSHQKGGMCMKISRVMAAILGMAALLGGPVQAEPAEGTAPGGMPPMAKFAKVSKVVQDKCMACHTQGYDLPFYAKVPGIRQII